VEERDERLLTQQELLQRRMDADREAPGGLRMLMA